MIHRLHEVHVEIGTPSGAVFRGFSKAVTIKARKQAIIEFGRNWVNYVSLSDHAELIVQEGTGCRQFLLKNAMARLDKEKLLVLAETVTSRPGATKPRKA